VTKHKAEKRAVRERMAKTGERYTTARHYLLDLHHVETENGIVGASAAEAELRLPDPETTAAAPAAASAEATAPAWVEQPGMSDEAILRNTGKTWAEWFALLDHWGATERTHAEIARHVYETSDISGWWAQGVTVGYERARGMRKRHERPDGFSVNASKTVAAPVERLFAAFVDDSLRDQWLEPGTLRLRTSQPERSARFDIVATGTVLTANFTAKGESKASVQLQELKIATEDDVESRKTLWKASLNRLAAMLTT
jgi:uncharacterized protein YndB with AHSA1/START domain